MIIRLIFSVILLTSAGHAKDTDTDATGAVGISIDTVTIDHRRLTVHDFREDSVYLPWRIGLALSGGGARGMAQIGVLKAFDEAGIGIACIAGSSMGSVIGGLYASGYTAEEIEEIVRDVDFSALFSNAPQRRSMLFTQREEQARYLLSIRFDGLTPYIPRALTAGQRLTSLLTDLTIRADYRYGRDFENLPVPFRAVAADIASGSEVVIREGSLADAMRASMAFPLAFTPVELHGRHLVDGGIVNPLPVHVCRKMGADYVVAVNTASQLLPADKIDDPIDIAGQVTTIMSQNALTEQLRAADYIIDPRIAGVEFFDFEQHDTLVAVGYRVGKRAVSDILRQLRRSAVDDGHILVAIETAGDDPRLDSLLRRFPISEGQSCRVSEIERALAHADRDLRFHRLQAIVTRRDNTIRLVLDGESNRACDDITYRFEGNTVMSDSQMAAYFPHDGDSILSLRLIRDAADSIIRDIRDRGYDLAHISDVVYDHDSGTVTVSIDEGVLEYVDIRGNDRTRSWIIKANYPLRPGEPFDVRKSDRGQANIYATGFFERVSLEIEPTVDGTHLTINVKEKKFTQLRLGGHWHDEYQAEMFAELLDDNILGAGIQALAHAHVGSYRNKYHLSFKVNRLSRALVSASTKFYFSRLRRRLFQPDGAPDGYRIEDRLGWSLTLGQSIARLGAIDIRYRLEDINTQLTIPDVTDNHVFSAFTVSSTVETFNKFPYPDYGHRQDIAAEFSGKWLGGTFDESTKLYGMLEAYLPLGQYLNFHPKVSAGISTADLPDIEKYYIGGMDSFYGYRADQLYGDKYVVTNLQLRINLPYRLYLSGNFDYGNVFDDYENIKIDDFRRGYGAAISYDSPFGPLDFGYGNAEDMPWRLYLNVGLRF